MGYYLRSYDVEQLRWEGYTKKSCTWAQLSVADTFKYLKQFPSIKSRSENVVNCVTGPWEFFVNGIPSGYSSFLCYLDSSTVSYKTFEVQLHAFSTLRTPMLLFTTWCSNQTIQKIFLIGCWSMCFWGIQSYGAPCSNCVAEYLSFSFQISLRKP